MMNNNRKILLLNLMAVFVAQGITVVEAQEDSSLAIEEIMITAQRKTENLQDVPISVSAFSANFLNEAGISDTMELVQVTPGLTYGTQQAGGVPFIRGVGNTIVAAGQDTSVATYVDDVYMSNSATAVMSLNNIERIEVLKGPQGTLFGRNATGGLIHVITKEPSYETLGNIELSYDNFDTPGVSFYGTTGLNGL